MSDLASLLAHEIEPSLVALELRLRPLLEQPECREPVRACLEEVRSLRGILDQLRGLSTRGVSLERFLIAPVIEAIARRFDPVALDRGVRLAIHPSSASLSAEGDPRATERALASLVDNAIKFSARGGAVRVSVRSGVPGIAIEVEDDGPGIPEEHRERIFEPFFRLDRERPGSGLGLAIARTLVEAEGGTLEVESTPGGGSRFRLALRAR